MANGWAHHLEPLASLPRRWEQGCGSEGDPAGRPRKMRSETRERREGDRQREDRSYCLWLKIALKLHVNSASQVVCLFWAILSVSQLTHFFPQDINKTFSMPFKSRKYWLPLWALCRTEPFLPTCVSLTGREIYILLLSSRAALRGRNLRILFHWGDKSINIILKEIVPILDSMNMGLEVGIRVVPTETWCSAINWKVSL